ncbi:MAG: hypothetical protein JWM18_1079 [Chloroflexi bacterium]|nr:hypothetical protein [Chloroflexota bacterium]
MKKVRLLSAGAIAGMAGVLVLPMSAHADTAAPTGTAQASALQVSISPSALISAVPAVGQLLSQTLGGVLGNTDLSIKVDAANANGVLTGNLLDLLSGHGDSTPIDIQFAPLQQELDTLSGAVKTALGALNGVTGLLGGSSGLTSALGNGGLLSGLTGLLGTNSSVVGQLTSLTSQLPILGNLLNGILGGTSGNSLGSVDGALKGLGVNLGNTLVANYNVPGVTDAPTATSSVIATPAGAPIQLNLAPYHADAVSNSLAQAAGIAGARASADNSTTSLAVVPSLTLPNLSGLLGTGGGLGNLLGPSGLLSSLLNTTSGLPVVGSLLSGIVGAPSGTGGAASGLLGGLPLGGAVTGVLGSLTGGTGSSGLLGGVLGTNGLLGNLGGITNGVPVLGSVLSGVTGSSSGGSVLGILGNNGGLLSGLLGNGGLLGNLTNLNGLLGGLLGPNGLLGGLLNGQNLGLNSLIKTAGITSNSIVQPMGGGSFQSLASTKVASVQVLPLGDQILGDLTSILGGGTSGGLTSALNGIVGGLNLGSLTNLGPLSGLLGGAGSTGGLLSGLPLLEITGISSSAQAILGPNAGDPTGASSLGAIKVLGIPVVNLDQVLGIAVGTSKTIAIPATGISLIIDRGVPQIGMNTATSKSVSVAALNVRLVNDGTGLLGSLLSAGNTSKPITEVAVANSVASVSTSAPANATVPAIAPINGPTPPSTGMFGPASFAAAGILAALAIALQVFPRLAARRGRVR